MEGRDVRIWQAVLTSLLAKGGGFAMQVVAFPIVLRVLGVERFGVFSLVSSVLAFISFAQFGLGGHLTKEIAQFLARKDYDAIREVVWSAIIAVGVVALLLCIIMGSVCWLFGLEWLWGEVYSDNVDLLRWGFTFMLIVGWFNILGNTLAGCQAGYQELHIGGLYLGLGNLFCATGMVILAQQSETTEKSFWLVLYGVPLLLVGCSVFHFLLRHKELRWKPFKFKFEVFRSLFLGGGGFMIVQTIGPFLQGEGTRLYLAHKSDVFQVALMSVFIQVSTIVMGFVVLFVNPLYGAVADALARGDRQWILSKIKKVRLMGLLVVSVLIIIMFFGGPKTFDIWLGSQMVVSRINCLILACYIGAIILVYINQVFLMAMGFLRLSVLVAVLEIICLVVFLFFVKPQTAGLMIAGMALIKFLSSLPLTIIALKSKV